MGYQGIKPPCVQCGEPHYSRRLCRNCYYRVRYAGKLDDFPPISANEAFMNRIQKTDSCWLWTAGKTTAGYGMITLNRKNVYAHRYAYELFIGKIPEGLNLMHSCDNPGCVNPWHLTPDTQLQNCLDAKGKGRLKHGEQHHNCRLSTKQVEAIRADTRKQTEIASDYGIKPQYVSRIKTGKNRAMG